MKRYDQGNRRVAEPECHGMLAVQCGQGKAENTL